jgi:hypothetical protein
MKDMQQKYERQVQRIQTHKPAAPLNTCVHISRSQQ